MPPASKLIQESEIPSDKIELQRMMVKSESDLHRHFNPDYQNLRLRQKIFLKKISHTCSVLNFKKDTKHLAMAITDNITSKYLLSKEDFKNVALVALSFAAKIKESQRKVLLLNSFKSFKSISGRMAIEQEILTELAFNLNIITPFDLVSNFLTHPETFSGIRRRAKREFIKTIFKITSHTALNYQMNKYTSLVVALCVLMVARKVCGCSRLLPKFLESFSGFSKETLSECFSEIYFFVCRNSNISKVKNPIFL